MQWPSLRSGALSRGGLGLAVALVAVAAVPFTGCGSGSAGSPVGEAASPAPSGRDVFLMQCSGCHALSGFGAPRPVGGDLSGYSMSPRDVASYARVMPTPRRLTRRELAAVASFVSEGQRRAKSRSPQGSSARAPD